MRLRISWFFLILLYLQQTIASENFETSPHIDNVVTATKRIHLKDFDGAYNPSILAFGKGYLLSFRYCPDSINKASISFIGVVLLDQNFDPISHPQLLNTRSLESTIPSQSEDARIFSYKGRIFLIYNDSHDKIWFYWNRRDMYIAELLSDSDQKMTLSTPLKLQYEKKYHQQKVQKNWVPFEWDNTLLLGYSIDPHEIIYPNLYNGICYPCYETSTPIEWNYGTLRGSTPPILVDGEYLAFFHSGKMCSSSASWGLPLWHYFMGAYTFSDKPPFEITKMTLHPITAPGFYTPSDAEKRVIFPGGMVVSGPNIYVAYGKDDCEIWIATINKERLKKALTPCKKD